MLETIFFLSYKNYIFDKILNATFKTKRRTCNGSK